jgi:hypothetical protein
MPSIPPASKPSAAAARTTTCAATATEPRACRSWIALSPLLALLLPAAVRLWG